MEAWGGCRRAARLLPTRFRALADELLERAAEIVRVLVAQRKSDLFDGEAVSFQQFLCPRHLQSLMIHGWRLPMMRMKHPRECGGGDLQILAKSADRVGLGEVLRQPANRQLHSHGWFRWLRLALNVPRHGDVDCQMQLFQREFGQFIGPLDLLPTQRVQLLQLVPQSCANCPLPIRRGGRSAVRAARTGAPDPHQQIRHPVGAIRPTAGAVRVNDQEFAGTQNLSAIFEDQSWFPPVHEHVVPAGMARDWDWILPVLPMPPRQVQKIQLCAFGTNPTRATRRRKIKCLRKRSHRSGYLASTIMA